MKTSLRVCAGFIVVLLVSAAPADAQVHRVLLLQSLDRGNLTMDEFTAAFRLEVEKRSSSPVTFVQHVVNPSGFDVSPEKPILDYLIAAFENRPKPDLIVAIGGSATEFARKYRKQLFPDAARLYVIAQQWLLQTGPLSHNETAVASAQDLSLVVDDILQLFPGTSNVFMVMGSGPIGRFWRREMEREFERFKGRVNFIWSDDLSYAEILQRVGALPPGSAIYFLTFGTDMRGGAYPEDRVLAEIREVANAPLFGALSAAMGHGIIGGMLLDNDQSAHRAADVALRIFNGESPDSIRLPVQAPGPRVYDSRELERWGISESRLPPDSVVRFREPGVWQRFKWVIIASVAALLAQGLLIASLLVNRAKRRRAEQALRQNVSDIEAARGALSNLSGRLMEAQEQERTRLARELHDDLGQRVSFLAMDVARLRDALPDDANLRGQARTLQDAVVAFGRDVQGLSHRLHSSKIDVLGLPAAAANFCQEVASRHDLNVEFAHDNVPSRLPEGVPISLFRVIQEAVANAVKHANARHCRVTLRGTDGELRLDVVDDGRGFNTDAALNGHGLGLISMQERLKLVNGRVVIESKRGAGTTVRATVPLSPTGAPASQLASSALRGGTFSTTA
jgi:signal transduction histidine kinase